jgi:phytoene/squalene synthetase
VLGLLGVKDARAQEASDNICTALQLINFWQDVRVDWAKARVYLPQEDLQRFNVAESDIAESRTSPAWRRLMHFQTQRARERMMAGAPLLAHLRGRMKLEIALTMAGGLTILDKIEHVHYDVFRHRPQLTLSDAPRLFFHTLRSLRS